MERLELGAFKRSFAEERAGMRVLLEHGQDPQLGNKPIATIADLLEETAGAYYEAPLLEGVPLLVVAGIRAGQYGASFRFRVEREEIVEDPGVSEHNPHGLPERTIKEVSCMEFGPVTWGAYPTATAGMRSLTAEFMERAHSRG
jgi:phage head maturation protease